MVQCIINKIPAYITNSFNNQTFRALQKALFLLQILLPYKFEFNTNFSDKLIR
jgi:hypothetical protein